MVFDLIIVGAGINGAGIARDAAMRGLRVLLIDKGDVGSGTSSYSTRLIHGGLRYLEHLEFGLVRESLREREILLRIASHLVAKIPILFPIYRTASRGKWAIRAGMIAYDALSLGKSLPRHRMLSRRETLERSPGLNPNGLEGAAVYFDCQVEFAERLVLANALSAKDHGAEVLTYATVTSIKNGSVEFKRRGESRSETATGQIVINAAGPWVDQLHLDQDRQLISGTKGSHIVVRSFPGAPDTAHYVEAVTDRRPFFVIPWNNNYLIGTTDVRFKDDLDEVRSEKWEVDYLLSETNHVFPDAKLSRVDVCYTYAGVRPLPHTHEKDERRITRRHFINEHAGDNQLLSIVGGKLTTYRNLAEQCVDLVLQKMGKEKGRCRTGEVALPGAVELVDLKALNVSSPFSANITSRLSHLYGSRTRNLIDLCRDKPQLAQTFNKDGDAIAAEVVYAFESEFATTLTDCLLRRTMLGLNADLAIGDDEAAAEICRQWLGWSEQRAKEEVAQYRSTVRRMRQIETD